MFLSQRPCLESLSVCRFVSETSSFGVMSEIMKTQIQELPHMETIKN